MTTENVIKILEYYPEIEGNIKYYRDRIREFEDEYYRPSTTMDNDGQPKGKNHISRTTENLALNIPDYVAPLLSDYEAKIAANGKLRAEIINEVSRLKRAQKEIIFDRYIHGMKWERVAQRNNYSVRQCDNLRRQALDILADRFGGNAVIAQFDITK